MIELTQSGYSKIYKFFRDNKLCYKLLCLVYRVFPIIIAIGYIITVVLAIAWQMQQAKAVVIIPAITFCLVSVIRRIFDKPRPYEVLKIKPLIYKDKSGKSFPSRHCASAFVISVCVTVFVNFGIGLVFGVMAVCVAVSRVLAGVHFVRDVLFGSAFGIFMGVLGLLII